MNTTPLTTLLRAEPYCTAAEAAVLITSLSSLVARSGLVMDRKTRIAAYELLDEAADILAPGSSEKQFDPKLIAAAMAEHTRDLADDARRAGAI